MVKLNLTGALLQSLLVGLMFFSSVNAMAVEKASSTKMSTSTKMTTSPKPSKTCSQVAKSPLPTGFYCGVQGRLKKAKLAMKTYPGKHMDDCLDHCLETKGCHAFALDMTGSSCSLFNNSIESQNFKASVSNQYFWNPKCFKKSCGTVNATSLTTITSKSSTITKAPVSSSGTSSTSSASVPLTTIDTPGPGKDCVVPLPLNVRNCLRIQQQLNGARIDYRLYFNGTGVVESTANAGNNNAALPSFTITMKGEKDGCDAAIECAEAATSLGSASIYHSFDLHYRLSACAWECVLFGGYNDLTSAFSVKDSDAFRTHGYTGKMKIQDVSDDMDV